MDEDSHASLDSSTESDSEINFPRKEKVAESRETKHKPGIIYLSTVPSGYNVSQTTAFFSEFGRWESI